MNHFSSYRSADLLVGWSGDVPSAKVKSAQQSGISRRGRQRYSRPGGQRYSLVKVHEILRMSNLLKMSIVLTALFIATIASAQENAKITGTSLHLEETADGITITLEGPVEVIFAGDTLTADSGIVKLASDLSSLDNALQSVELTGNVTYSGDGGASATGGRATYFAQESRLVVTGQPAFKQANLTVTAGNLEYIINSRLINLSGGCTITESPIMASAGSASYNLNDKTGNLSGNVEIRYEYGAKILSDEIVDEIVMRSESLFISVKDMVAKTPDGPNAARTTITAGSFTLAADKLTFEGGESDLTKITANGDVVLDGPNRHLQAETISVDTSEGLIHADGGDGLVEFSIMGQNGTAESIEVNFKEHWTIRLLGGSVGGEINEPTNGGE